MMKVLIINKSDATGGAAVVSFRLLEALRDQGVDARMLVCEKLTDSPYVEKAASSFQINKAFILERLKIFSSNGFNRKNLFSVDAAAYGIDLHNHPLVRWADVVCLNWINQGMLSLKGIRSILKLGKPIVWTMHDMWCATSICHHAHSCRKWLSLCHNCPLLNSFASKRDLSYHVWKRKREFYSDSLIKGMHFVAVSNWLAAKFKESALTKDLPVMVIPNPFKISDKDDREEHIKDKFVLLFGAARLDDPVKGLPILIEATRYIKENHAHKASKLQIVTFGSIKNEELLKQFQIEHIHLGRLYTKEQIKKVYHSADAVVSTSLYETLPTTLVEGQVYGCIPISFNRGGQSDIIDHLSTGYLAEWNDDPKVSARNIAEGILWASGEQRNALREKMLTSAKLRFSSEIVAKSYIDLFKKLLSKNLNRF